MRAARLLQILLILQNRGRQSSVQLAQELEVSTRTILRDVDAMTEAGLPILVHPGHGGGIELGFNYRTRLTGLERDEAAALGLILSTRSPMIAALGLEHAATRAQAKLIESLPDRSRHEAQRSMRQFKLSQEITMNDPRIRAMAHAVRAASPVRLRFATTSEQLIHPVRLSMTGDIWSVQDDLAEADIPYDTWGRLNIAARAFTPKSRATP